MWNPAIRGHVMWNPAIRAHVITSCPAARLWRKAPGNSEEKEQTHIRISERFLIRLVHIDFLTVEFRLFILGVNDRNLRSNRPTTVVEVITDIERISVTTFPSGFVIVAPADFALRLEEVGAHNADTGLVLVADRQ